MKRRKEIGVNWRVREYYSVNFHLTRVIARELEQRSLHVQRALESSGFWLWGLLGQKVQIGPDPAKTDCVLVGNLVHNQLVSFTGSADLDFYLFSPKKKLLGGR